MRSRTRPARSAVRLALSLGLSLGVLSVAGPSAAQPSGHDRAAAEDRPSGDRSFREQFRERRERMREARGLTPEQIAERHAEVMAVLHDIDPQLADRFAQAGDNGPPGIQMFALERRFPEVFRLAKLRGHDRPMYDLRVRELQLYRQMQLMANQIRLAQRQIEQEQEPQVEIDDLRDELDDLAEGYVEAKLAAEELELQRFEERLEKMQARLDEQDRNQRQIVERTVQALLRGESLRSEGYGPRGPGGDPSRRGEMDDSPHDQPRGPRDDPPRSDELDL